jgi:hypothetical protein
MPTSILLSGSLLGQAADDMKHVIEETIGRTGYVVTPHEAIGSAP